MPETSVANESIYGFLPAGQEASVQPSEEPIFVLTGSQLQEIISRAVLPLQAELQDLKDTVALQGEKLAALEATQDTLGENDLNQLRLIADLRKVQEPQPLQRDRGEILRALLAANGGKMLAKEARMKMRLSRSAFSQLLTTLRDKIEVKPYHLRKNQKLLVLKSCLTKQ